MKKFIISGILALTCVAFSHNSLVWAQADELKTLTPEQMAEALRKLEEAQQKLKRVFKNVPKVDNAGSITGVVTCAKVRDNADAIVYVEKVGDGKYAPPTDHAIIDQLNLTYVPRVVAMQKGTTADFPNSDAVRHNVFSPPTAALQFNLGTYPTGVVKEVLFDVTGETPLLCNVHAEMAGYAVAFENPYFALTDKAGNYTIEGVPPGKYVVKTWHEKLKEVSQDVTVEGGKAATANFDLKR
ncbi:MAG: carboxypeptidase regulatory-like domain-containing protein, partial [Planctomycetota bacterium]